MPKEIELPDGSIAEFPDDMEDDQIAAVLSQKFKAPGSPQEPSRPEPMAQEPEDIPSEPPEANLTLAERLGGMIPKGIQEWATGESEASGLTSEPKSASEAGLRSGLGAFKNEAVGALKGLGQLAVGAGETVREGGRRLGLIKDDVDGARRRRSLSERIRGTQEALGLQPEGFSQELGEMASKTLPVAASLGSGLIPQVAGNAALSGGQIALEGGDTGDVALASGLGALGPLASKGLGKLAPWLRGRAVEQYTKALHPTGRPAKIEAERIVPELLRRRVTGSLEGLASKGAQLSEEAGEAIEKTYAGASKAGKRINAKQLADDLEQLKAPFIGDATDQAAAFSSAGNSPERMALAARGKMALNPTAVEAISSIQDQLRTIKPDPENLWKLRKNLDNIVQASNGFMRPLPPQAMASIARDARSVIQKELTKANPNIAKLNEEYRLWESLQHVAGETALRKTGQQGASGMLARAAGGVAGAAIGGPGGAIVGQGVSKQLTDIVASPRWRTISAVQKARIADLMSRGAQDELAQYLSRLAGVSAGRKSQDVKREIEAQRIRRQLER